MFRRIRHLLGLVAAASCFCALFALAPAANAAAFEPNDSLAQAYGPLVGDQNVHAAIETTNDVDFFYFYTSGQVQLQLQVTGTPSNSDCGLRIELQRGDNGERLARFDLYSGQITGDTDTITYTAPGARKYVVRVQGDSAQSDLCGHNYDTYDLIVRPALALTTNPPPPALAPECVVANARVDVATRRVQRAVRTYRRTRGRAKKRRAARKVRIARAKLRRAIQNANSACAAPAEY